MINILFTVNYKPWGLVPTLFFISAVILTTLSVYAGKKWVKNDKTFNLITIIISILFVAMEVIHEVGRYKYFGSYDWSSFPFQLCSVSMYLAIICPFIKNEKHKKGFLTFFALFTFLSGILPLIFGQGNLTRWNTFGGVLFSFAWHILLMMLAGVSIGYSGIGLSFKEDRKYIISSIIIFFGLTCIAQVLNFSIHTFIGGWEMPLEGFKEAGYMPNYELDPDSCSLFYISPYFKSNIPVVFDKIWLNLGWVLCWIIYVVAFSFGALLIYASIYGTIKVVNLILNKDKVENAYE